MKDYDSIPVLHRINVPTLLYNGEFDTVQDESVTPLFNHIPHSRWRTLAGASHMPHLDSEELRDKTLQLVGDFLTPAE